jgi:hypothetical protein
MSKNFGLYGFLLVAGIALLGYAVSMMQTTNRLSEGGIKTTATLVEIKKTTDSNGMDMFQPVFEFKDSANQTIQYAYDQMSSPPKWAVGHQMGLVYNPKNKAEVKLDKGWDLVGMPTILFLLGLGLALFALRQFLFGK